MSTLRHVGLVVEDIEIAKLLWLEVFGFTGKIAKPRSNNKWFRWSRELMIAGIGIKSE